MIKISDYEKQNMPVNFNSWLQEDFYKILGISAKASIDEINKAFKKKAKSCNPLIYAEHSVKRIYAESKLKHLLTIRETLLNPVKKEKYDQERQILQDCYLKYISSTFNIFESDKKQVKSIDSINKERIKKYVSKNNINYNLANSDIDDLNDMFQLCFSKEEILH